MELNIIWFSIVCLITIMIVGGNAHDRREKNYVHGL